MTSKSKSPAPKPTVSPTLEDPKFGFNGYAERLNGRAAMIGFIAALAIEAISHEGVLTWLGFIAQ
jgi:hypothetical protein